MARARGRRDEGRRYRWPVPTAMQYGSGSERRPEAGIALLEVLVTGVVLSIAVVGVALMFSLGNAWVVAGGDERVALNLARQKIEQLRSLTFACIPLDGPGTKTAMTGCTATQNYNEGPTTWVTASGAAGPQPTPTSRTYTRKTCVEYVSDTSFSSPAYAGGTAATPCTNTATVTNTKRIVVIVQPTRSIEAEPPVTLQAWITAVPGGL